MILMNGTVKWFNETKGYGFIQGEDNTDYFVHISEIPENARLGEGDQVTFEIEETDRGYKAVQVVLA